MSFETKQLQNDTTQQIDLSLFATSDLHGMVVPFDYTKQASLQGPSFAQLATLLETLRDKTPNSLLFDNGDLIQGTPFSDTLVTDDYKGMGMQSFLGLCAYDAATLGNHDLDFGPKVLANLIRAADFPFVSANLQTIPIEKPPQSIILDRIFQTIDGDSAALRIGITGCLPQQTQNWVTSMGPDLALLDPIEAIKTQVETLKAQNVDLIIVLAHSGYIADPNKQEPENFAQIISRITDVDAVFAGHLHFTAQSLPNTDGAPVAMPGSNASHLARIDLELTQTAGLWNVARHAASTIPVPNHTSKHRDVMNIAAGVHRQTNMRMRQRIGATKQTIHSFFSLITPSSAVEIIHQAQLWQLREIAIENGLTDLPQISVAAAGRNGGMEGEDSFTYVPQGNLLLHHFFDIYRFENQACATILAGADVLQWMERAASVFETIKPNQHDQLLMAPQAPGYEFDTFSGLDYEIDLAQPALFDRFGHRHPDNSKGRIREVKYQGKAIAPSQKFLIATNGFRANRFADARLLQTERASRDLLVEYVSAQTSVDPTPAPHWQFSTIKGATANIELPVNRLDKMQLPPNLEMMTTRTSGTNIYRVYF